MARNFFDGWHLVVIAIVILILFGWKKLPDMTRSFGRSARILRSEMDEMKNDKKSDGAGQTVKGETYTTGTAAGPVPDAPTGTAPSVPVEHAVPVKDPADHNTSA